jgi:hypothetical protein
MMNKRIVAAALGAAILAIPATAVADSGHGTRRDKPPAATKVTFVFKGIFTAPGTIEVRSGNAHARKGRFVGQKLNFDLTTARVVAADRNADQKVDVSDVNSGDVVLVQARLRKGTKYVAPTENATIAALVASKLIDKTNPPADDE